MTKLTFETLVAWMNQGVQVDFAVLGFDFEMIVITSA